MQGVLFWCLVHIEYKSSSTFMPSLRMVMWLLPKLSSRSIDIRCKTKSEKVGVQMTENKYKMLNWN